MRPALAAAAWLAVRMLRPETITVDAAAAVVGPLVVTVGDEGQTRVRHPAPHHRAGRRAARAHHARGRRHGQPRDGRGPAGSAAARRTEPGAGGGGARGGARPRADERGGGGAGPHGARAGPAGPSRGATELAARGGLAPADVERLQLTEQARAREVEAAEARARAATHDVERAQSALLASGTAAGGRDAAAHLPDRRARPRGSRAQRADGPARGSCCSRSAIRRDLEIVVDLLSTDAVQGVARSAPAA